MAGDGIGDNQIRLLKMLTKTVINDNGNRSIDAIRTFGMAWLYAALEIPEVEHYEKIAYAFMKIVDIKSGGVYDVEFISLMRQCDARFSKYDVDSLVEYYLKSEFVVAD